MYRDTLPIYREKMTSQQSLCSPSNNSAEIWISTQSWLPTYETKRGGCLPSIIEFSTVNLKEILQGGSFFYIYSYRCERRPQKQKTSCNFMETGVCFWFFLHSSSVVRSS